MNDPLPPPHDLVAERSVISALLLDPERLAVLETILRPGDFFDVRHRRIAEAIWDLDAQGAPVDLSSVASRLHGTDKLKEAGGTPYLTDVHDATPAILHVEEHARVVAAAARIRRVQNVCRTVAAEGYGALGDAAAWLQSVEARILAATDASSMGPDSIALLGDATALEFDELRERANGTRAIAGRPTRIYGIDKILNGLVDGVPYVVAGRPGHGKTALAWQVAEGVATTGALVAFLSQEMPRPQLVQRAIAQLANIEPGHIRRGKLDAAEWSRVATAVGFLEKLPVAIDDRAGQTVHSARSAVRRCVQKLRTKGFTSKLGLVVIDYLQIMGGERQRGESRSTEVADNMHGLTRLAKDFGCPVLVLSQLNRDIDKRPDKRPRLSDLGESGAIEADAYGVLFVYREDCYRDEAEHDGLAEVIIAKHRNGRSGTVGLRYMSSTLFAGVADEFDEAAQGTLGGDEWHGQQ